MPTYKYLRPLINDNILVYRCGTVICRGELYGTDSTRRHQTTLTGKHADIILCTPSVQCTYTVFESYLKTNIAVDYRPLPASHPYRTTDYLEYTLVCVYKYTVYHIYIVSNLFGSISFSFFSRSKSIKIVLPVLKSDCKPMVIMIRIRHRFCE